jgi:glucose/arabinose dehydrogenase
VLGRLPTLAAMKALSVLLVTGLLALAACDGDSDAGPSSLGTPQDTPQPTTRTAAPRPSPPDRPTAPRVVSTVASGLAVPWGITFLPDGTALVSERDSTRVLAVDGKQVREVGRVAEASPQGEAGLLGLAVSPSYDEDRLVYAYVSTAEDNRVVRMTYDGDELGPPEPVLTGIPNGFIHDGGRLLFDDDGNLFVSTGETGEPSLAQDATSLGGKVLHITPDGAPAPGNPVDGSPVWSMGHRNIQGLAFDDRGRLWSTEFGEQTWDELNLISRGQNYGWPLVEGKGDLEEYRNPHVTWATVDASPSGLAFADGSLWAGALRGERLWEIPVTANGTAAPKDWFVGDYGRIRTVTVAPDGNLWVTTSNRDGRGEPTAQDDRILEIRIQ